MAGVPDRVPVGPLDGEDPFSSIEAARSSWSSGEDAPALDGLELGPRTAHDPTRGTQTIDAYRAWAARAGSQAAAFSGESAWTPERRFAARVRAPGAARAFTAMRASTCS